MNNKYIIVLGNYGSGQDIICNFLKRRFKKVKIMKTLNKTPSKQMDFVSQMEMVTYIYEAIQKNDKFYKNHVFVLDNIPYFIQDCIIPALHNMNKINEREVLVFRRWVKILNKFNIEMIINLKYDINRCFERILETDPNIDYNYLRFINTQISYWADNNPHFSIDMNKYITLEENEMYEKELFKLLMKYKSDFFNTLIH